MKTLFLLVLLSQNGAGDVNASFVNTESLEQCQQKALMIEGIFSTAKIPILERRCLSSNLMFSEFDHAASTQMPRQFYLIHFEPDAVTIKLMPDWSSCMQGQQTAVSPGRFYCGSSTQELRSNTE